MLIDKNLGDRFEVWTMDQMLNADFFVDSQFQ
ncbi:hypothetical protein NIES22_56640 [Calothrix brevissima NIES-22]|nr:hypothetical protein NIES22_56640 [Calothrix brevissima NIES-22]